MKLLLTEEQIEFAKRIADIRNAKNGLVPNMRESRAHKDWEINFYGALGEVAVASQVNYPPALNFSMNGDSGAPDLYFHSHRIEVKTALHWPPILKLNHVTDFVSDVIVLCYVDKKSPDAVTIAGCVSRRKFERDHYIRNFKYGDRACMDFKKMTPLTEFMELAQRPVAV